MKYILLISCLLLCSCPFEEETEPKNEPLSSPSSVAVPSSSSVDSSSSSSVEPEPSILDCPLEDIDANITKYYPDPEFDPPPPPPGSVGWCAPSRLELSAEELSFNAQGGVRCITARSLMAVSGKSELGCYTKMIVRFPDGSTFTGTMQEIRDFNVSWKFKKLVCPWFTATAVDVDDWTEGRRTLHISVNQNETGNERETPVGVSMGNCHSGFKITQSPN